LGDAVDALLGNVFAHTPEGSPLAVALGVDDGGLATIVVDDQGPGFSGTVAMERGVSGGGSTGLGLDIARRVAESAGGALTVSRSPLGGARVQLTLQRRLVPSL